MAAHVALVVGAAGAGRGGPRRRGRRGRSHVADAASGPSSSDGAGAVAVASPGSPRSAGVTAASAASSASSNSATRGASVVGSPIPVQLVPGQLVQQPLQLGHAGAEGRHLGGHVHNQRLQRHVVWLVIRMKRKPLGPFLGASENVVAHVFLPGLTSAQASR